MMIEALVGKDGLVRWRPQSMESEGPGVFAFTIVLGENRPAHFDLPRALGRWERFQISLDGDSTRVLHPVYTQVGAAPG